jgi:3-oxoacyl-[acyl-carrier protein] reductase
MELKGKTAIVTGASRGIGKAIALMLANEGCNMVLAARDMKKLKACESEVAGLGVQAICVKCDLTSSADIRKLVAAAVKKFKGIDILVNNAGVAYRRTVAETTEAELDETLSVDLRAPFLLCKYVVPSMEKQGSGVIVNISSGAGKHGFPEMGAYCAAKFGVIGLTESLHYEVNHKGIRVYAVCPGAVATDMLWSLFPEMKNDPSVLQPEDVAAKVVDLCRSESAKSGKSYNVYKARSMIKFLRERKSYGQASRVSKGV